MPKRQKNDPFGARPPKKMTKGLKRHLTKVERQNKVEAEAQRLLVPQQ
jgi:hypothetical protein